MIAVSASTVGLAVCAVGIAATVALIGSFAHGADQAAQRERRLRLQAVHAARLAEAETKKAREDAAAWAAAYEFLLGSLGWADEALAEIRDLPDTTDGQP